MNNEETEDISDPGKNPTLAIGILTIPTSGIEMHLSGLKAYGPDGIPPPPRFLKENAQEISITTVSIPELYPANGNMPTYVPFTRKERNRIHQTIGPYHLLASLQKYLSTLCTAML